MRLMIVALGGLILTACASVAAVNPDGGIVENAATAGEALHKANAYCQKSARTAKAKDYNTFWGTLNFECVAK